MGSEGFVVTYEALIWICGFIITLGGATAVISRWLAPIKNLIKRVDDIELEVKNQKTFQNGDHDRIKDVETGNEKICKCVLAIINHELTGNSVDKMREARDEMQNYLIQK